MTTTQSPAKVNLFLEVTSKRPDGFHNIDSVFAEVDLSDGVSVWREAGDGIRVEVVGMDGIPTDGRNIVCKAVEGLRRRCGVGGGVAIRLEKRIPSGGGLGGGSSNAAAVLRLANDCLGAGLTDGELREIGAELGSDVSFFFYGGVCVCRGRGELVTPVAGVRGGMGIILALTGIHCDTAAGYRGLRLPSSGEERVSDGFTAALLAGDVLEMERLAFNRFEETVFAAYPELARIRGELEGLIGRPVRLSGSGGSLWFFAGDGDVGSGVEDWAERNGVRLVPCRIRGSL